MGRPLATHMGTTFIFLKGARHKEHNRLVWRALLWLMLTLALSVQLLALQLSAVV